MGLPKTKTPHRLRAWYSVSLPSPDQFSYNYEMPSGFIYFFYGNQLKNITLKYLRASSYFEREKERI